MKRILLLLFVVNVLCQKTEAQVYGQTIVNWDFADGIPSDWIVGINSTTDLAHWEYRGPNTTPNYLVGARGTCSAIAQPIGSVTQSNGFVIFDSNYWDDSGTICGANFGSGIDPAPHIAWLITNPVDMSTVTNAVLTFQQQYRHYQASTKVQLSTDGGTNWTDILVNNGIQSPNTQWQSINISSLAGGQSSVQFRFQFDGTYYWWILDDISIYVPNDNDIMLLDARYTQNSGPETVDGIVNLEYDQYPLSMIPPMRFNARAQNVGGLTQNGVALNTRIIKDGVTEIYNNTGNGINVQPSQNLPIQIAADYTNAASLGNYEVFYRVVQNQTDQNLANNVDSADYSITPYTYAIDEGPMENTYTPDAFYDNYSMIAGNFFEAFTTNQYCHSLQIGVAEGTPVGKNIKGVIYNRSLENLLAETEIYSVNQADLNSPGEEDLVTLHFPTPFAMQNDSIYFVAIAEVDSLLPFRVARSGQSYGESALIRYPNVNASFLSARSILVRMNLFPQSAQTGCTDPSAMNFDAGANTEDGSCRYPGCTYELADNFDPAANFDNGTCAIGGCMDPGASNYNPLVTYDNGSCLYPGCTDPTALNFNPGANIDNGSCTFLFTQLQVSNYSGCPPLTINVDNLNVISGQSQCEFMINDNIINESCDPEFTYTLTEPGIFELTYTITVGNAIADTTVLINVYAVPDTPEISYNGFGMGISCINCGSNDYFWYYQDQPVAGSDNTDLSIIIDDQHQNGQYQLQTTNQFGCTSISEPITVVQPYMASTATEGCVPFNVTITDLTYQIDGLSSTLNNGDGDLITDFTGNTNLFYDTPGSYEVTLTSTLGNVSNVFTIEVNVYSAETPLLVNNETNGTIDCTNCDLFEDITWNIDGTTVSGGNSQPNGGNVYGISVATAEGCGANALLIIASVGEQENSSVQIFPNPASSALQLSSGQAFTCELYDMMSRKMQFGALNPVTRYTEDVGHIPSGLYHLVIRQDGEVIVKQIEIIH